VLTLTNTIHTVSVTYCCEIFESPDISGVTSLSAKNQQQITQSVRIQAATNKNYLKYQGAHPI